MTWPQPPDYFETPVGGFKTRLQKPPFPIIDTDPSFSTVAVNIRPGWYGYIAGLTATGASLGYYFGSKVSRQKPSMYFAAVFFGKTGVLSALGDSAYRLMGYKENAREVAANMPSLVVKHEAY